MEKTLSFSHFLYLFLIAWTNLFFLVEAHCPAEPFVVNATVTFSSSMVLDSGNLQSIVNTLTRVYRSSSAVANSTDTIITNCSSDVNANRFQFFVTERIESNNINTTAAYVIGIFLSLDSFLNSELAAINVSSISLFLSPTCLDVTSLYSADVDVFNFINESSSKMLRSALFVLDSERGFARGLAVLQTSFDFSNCAAVGETVSRVCIIQHVEACSAIVSFQEIDRNNANLAINGSVNDLDNSPLTWSEGFYAVPGIVRNVTVFRTGSTSPIFPSVPVFSTIAATTAVTPCEGPVTSIIEVVPVWCYIVIAVLAGICVLLIFFIILYFRRKIIKEKETDKNNHESNSNNGAVEYGEKEKIVDLSPVVVGTSGSSSCTSTSEAKNLPQNEKLHSSSQESSTELTDLVESSQFEDDRGETHDSGSEVPRDFFEQPSFRRSVLPPINDSKALPHHPLEILNLPGSPPPSLPGSVSPPPEPVEPSHANIQLPPLRDPFGIEMPSSHGRNVKKRPIRKVAHLHSSQDPWIPHASKY